MSTIETPEAPAAIGPYSQARIFGDLLFVSGQLPIDANAGVIASTNAAEQMRQCLTNLEHIVKAAGCAMSNVLKTTVLVRDLSQFAEINAAYAEFFAAPYPARTTFEAAALPKGALVEVDAIVSLRC
ncbi:Rid family detoxifying hydrolase [Pandoraea pulmonicola]|nr:Rid family detoxifying hydrolase [Pandoraea pulmonicola]AJC23639.1 reactive intermediate/imine deaminase [Pandoraea pulmonicola]